MSRYEIVPSMINVYMYIFQLSFHCIFIFFLIGTSILVTWTYVFVYFCTDNQYCFIFSLQMTDYTLYYIKFLFLTNIDVPTKCMFNPFLSQIMWLWTFYTAWIKKGIWSGLYYYPPLILFYFDFAAPLAWLSLLAF